MKMKNRLKQRYIDLFNELMKISMYCNGITDFHELEEICEEHRFNYKLVYYSECDYYIFYITDKDDTWIMEIWGYKDDNNTFYLTDISIN